MKFRTGFVANSSSSSFIVAFAHRPKSVADLKEMMFGKQEWHYTGIYGDGETDISTQSIAEAVFEDVKKKATKKQVYESIRNGYFKPYLIPELFPGIHMSDTQGLSYQNKEEKKEIDRIWKESDEINDARAMAIAEGFINGHDDKFIVVLRYSDEDSGLFSILEHSGIFKRLDHIITSYH
jgi:hypothetical protein